MLLEDAETLVCMEGSIGGRGASRDGRPRGGPVGAGLRSPAGIGDASVRAKVDLCCLGTGGASCRRTIAGA